MASIPGNQSNIYAITGLNLRVLCIKTVLCVLLYNKSIHSLHSDLWYV